MPVYTIDSIECISEYGPTRNNEWGRLVGVSFVNKSNGEIIARLTHRLTEDEYKTLPADQTDTEKRIEQLKQQFFSNLKAGIYG